jgi:hypothetical protein
MYIYQKTQTPFLEVSSALARSLKTTTVSSASHKVDEQLYPTWEPASLTKCTKYSPWMHIRLRCTNNLSSTWKHFCSSNIKSLRPLLYFIATKKRQANEARNLFCTAFSWYDSFHFHIQRFREDLNAILLLLLPAYPLWLSWINAYYFYWNIHNTIFYKLYFINFYLTKGSYLSTIRLRCSAQYCCYGILT